LLSRAVRIALLIASILEEYRVLPSLLLSLREGLEAALVIGIVLGALRKFNHAHLSPIVWIGAGAAAAASGGTALALNYLGASLEGQSEMLFEGTTLFLAAAVLTWMIFWMSRQSRTIQSDLEAGVRRATSRSGKSTLFFLAFISVLREGVELALFLTASALATGLHQTLLGALLGLAGAAGLGWTLFATTVHLNIKRFFQITGVLLILFAAGLVTSGMHEFIEVGWIPPVIEHLWNLNPLLNENSTAGQILKTLFGYNANPSLTEVLAYIAYFAAIGFGLRRAIASLPAVEARAR
jgi:high-affinity iron transporter